jgi:MFS transporter, FHS family, glucose/mannose:H+ symporter
MSRTSTVGGLLLAAAAGLLLSVYGPAIPELQETFGVGGGTSALALTAHFAGAMAGIAWWGLERRLAAGTWLRAATALMAAGAAGFAFVSVWALALVAAFMVGVGFGVLVVAVNGLFAEGFGQRGAAMLNLLGASFGAGAVLGPLAVAASGGFRVPFLAGALLAATAIPFLRDLPPARPPDPARSTGAPRGAPVPSGQPAGAPLGGRPAAGVVGGFIALCVLYVGVESGLGGWEATSLLANSAGEAAAANWTAVYWAAITAGRLLAIPLALRLAPPRLIAGALLLAAAGLALAHSPGLSPVAYTLTGLALGPVFPTTLAWLAAAAPGARASTALVFAAAQLGGVVLPALIGRMIDASSPAVIPTTLAGVALACLGMTLLLRRSEAAALR